MSVLLDLDRVSRRFDLPNGQAIEVLRDVSMTVSAGEVVAIVGRSGSGKSTLLNILGLLDRPTSGRFTLAGQDVAGLPDTDLARLRGASLGFIFQQFHLLDRRTALENVAEPALYGPRREIPRRDRRAAALLDRVGLSDRMQAMPHVLSGGEQQRVAIARALLRQPPIVLADEPTGSLDARTGDLVLELLLNLTRSDRVGLVIVTHDPGVASRADRVLTLADGRLNEA